MESIFHIVRNECGYWELWRNGRIVGVYHSYQDALDAA